MSIWTWLWLAWAAAFAVIEGVAVTNDVRGDTLSEHLRRWFRVDTHLGRTVWLVVSSLFAVLFIAHIATSGWML